MTDLRPTTPQDRRELKAVTRRQLEMAGGVTSFEHVTRVKSPQLSKYSSPDDDAYMPVDVVLDLLLDTGSNAILSYMAGKCGYRLVAMEADGYGAKLPGMADVASLLHGISQLVNAVSDAVADGVITPEEERIASAKMEASVQQIRALQRILQAAVTGGAK